MLLLSHILLWSLAQASSRCQEGESPQEDLQGLCPLCGSLAVGVPHHPPRVQGCDGRLSSSRADLGLHGDTHPDRVLTKAALGSLTFVFPFKDSLFIITFKAPEGETSAKSCEYNCSLAEGTSWSHLTGAPTAGPTLESKSPFAIQSDFKTSLGSMLQYWLLRGYDREGASPPKCYQDGTQVLLGEADACPRLHHPSVVSGSS